MDFSQFLEPSKTTLHREERTSFNTNPSPNTMIELQLQYNQISSIILVSFSAGELL